MVMVRHGKVTNFAGDPDLLQPDEQGMHYLYAAAQGVYDIHPKIDYTPIAVDRPFFIWDDGIIQMTMPASTGVVIVLKEIDVDRLKAAVDATDDFIDLLLIHLVEDYDLEPTADNIDAARNLIRHWIYQQAMSRGLNLKEDELSQLFNFTVLLAYESLHV